jgi:hypothetical protein
LSGVNPKAESSRREIIWLRRHGGFEATLWRLADGCRWWAAEGVLSGPYKEEAMPPKRSLSGRQESERHRYSV